MVEISYPMISTTETEDSSRIICN